eukprot:1573496-Pleurochrysis_carterae.AAC.5
MAAASFSRSQASGAARGGARTAPAQQTEQRLKRGGTARTANHLPSGGEWPAALRAHVARCAGSANTQSGGCDRIG